VLKGQEVEKHTVMKKLIAISLLCVGSAAAVPHVTTPSLEAAAPCKDIPLRVTIYANTVTDPSTGATTPSAILPDGGGEYLNGSSASALIKVCDGTNDAVLNVASTKRTFTYAFPAPVTGSVIQSVPTWVPATLSVSGWINVRNIIFDKGQQTPFTTHMGSTFSVSGDKSSYRLGFDPLQVDAPDLHSGDTSASIDNTPYAVAPATVYPTYPTVCGAGSMPSWLVRGATVDGSGNLELATLHKMPTNPGGSQTHEGQYSLPFEMHIEAMQCFAY
jgi:hypothetical protein